MLNKKAVLKCSILLEVCISFSFCSPDLPAEQHRIENSFYEYASRSITILFILAPTHLKYHKSNKQVRKSFKKYKISVAPLSWQECMERNPENNRAMFISESRRLSDLQY